MGEGAFVHYHDHPETLVASTLKFGKTKFTELDLMGDGNTALLAE